MDADASKEALTATQALVDARSRLYNTWQLFWFSVHYTAGLFAIVAGGLATAAVAQESTGLIGEWGWIWGLTASLLASVVTFLGPLQKAQTYKRAHYVLDKAAVDFRDDRITGEQLSTRLEEAHNIVLDMPFSSQANPVQKDPET